MLDDGQLLHSYATEGAQAAFGELVARHVNLVYSAALRRTGGDAHLAQDVAQLVFTDLARKVDSLPRNVVLAGWLHRATRFAAAQLLRAERRRQAREQEAVAMNALESEPAPDWTAIRPLLDEALDELGDADRDAVVLRFFEQRSLAEVGHALGANEDAARKRISRALDKLRAALVRRGIAATGAALSAVISANAIHAAPAGLATSVATASLAGAAAGSGTALTLLNIMTMTKLKVGIVSAVVVASVATPLLIYHQAQARLREKDASAQQQTDQLARLRAENERLSGLGATGSPAKNSLDDLQRLRREAETLRAQTNAFAALRDENRTLKAADLKRRISLEGKVQSKQETMAKVSFGRDWLVAFMMYADKNNDQFPPDFEVARPHLSGKAKTETNLTTDLFEIVYQGKLSDIRKPATTIVVRERQAVQTTDGKWMKGYGFADGHWELHTEPEDNFEAWEAERIVPPPAASAQ